MWLFGIVILIPGTWNPNHSQLIMSNLNKAACVLHAEHKQQHPAICAKHQFKSLTKSMQAQCVTHTSCTVAMQWCVGG